MKIERVYCLEAAWVGTEPYPTMPPGADMGPDRRDLWTFTEQDAGILIQYAHPSAGGASLVPWANVRSVSYAKPAKTEPAKGAK